MTHRTITRDAQGTLTKLGQGGQGIVYRAPKVKTTFTDAMVYKEYKPQARINVNFEALSALPTLVEDTLPHHDGQGLVSIAAWPCALVETSTGPVGFVMPAIPDSFYIDLTTVKGISRTTAEFQHLLNPPSVLTARGITITDAQRYQLLREVAKALAFLHRIGVCVGDISPKNLLFSLQARPAVYFIDCDAMRVNGVSALPQMETPEWEVPAGEELATIHSDTYKLGLLALRLLAGDQHTKNVQQLPSTTPKPLRQLITDTLTNKPDRRPLPEAWTYLLGNVIEDTHDRVPAPQTPTQPKPAPTHNPEPQPVVRSRPTATPGKNRVAATVPPSPTPASTQPATQSIPTAPAPAVQTVSARMPPPSAETNTTDVPSDKTFAVATFATVGAFVAVVLIAIIAAINANSNSESVSSPSSSTYVPFPQGLETTTPSDTDTSSMETTPAPSTTENPAPTPAQQSSNQPHWDGPWVRNYWEGDQDCNTRGLDYWVVQPGDDTGMYALKRGCFPQSWLNSLGSHCQSYAFPPGQCAVWDQDSIMSTFGKHGDLQIIALTRACLDRAGLRGFHEGPLHQDCVVRP